MLKSKRQCGSCSLCCKLMEVPGTKEPHQWCPHAKPGHGCSIYPNRPERCRDFNCMWLKDNRIPDYWYPKTSKIVINAFSENSVSYVAFVVDQSYPNRWREEPWFSDITQMARAGLDGKDGRKWTTFITVGATRIPIINSSTLLRAAK